MNATAMSRAFSKWWDRRKVTHGHRLEADAGWKAGAQWAFEEAAIRLEEGLPPRQSPGAAEDERRLCVDEIRELARDALK